MPSQVPLCRRLSRPRPGKASQPEIGKACRNFWRQNEQPKLRCRALFRTESAESNTFRTPSQGWVGRARATQTSRMRAAVPGFTNPDRNMRSISIGGREVGTTLALLLSSPLHRKRAEMELTEQCTSVAERPSLITVAPPAPVCLHAAAYALANDNIR